MIPTYEELLEENRALKAQVAEPGEVGAVAGDGNVDPAELPAQAAEFALPFLLPADLLGRELRRAPFIPPLHIPLEGNSSHNVVVEKAGVEPET